MSGMLCRVVMAAICWMGWMVPVTFEAWLIATSLVLGVIALWTCGGLMRPVVWSAGRRVIVTRFGKRDLSALSGRRIELCSISPTIAWVC